MAQRLKKTGREPVTIPRTIQTARAAVRREATPAARPARIPEPQRRPAKTPEAQSQALADALTLAKIQAVSLDDETAVLVPNLFDMWSDSKHYEKDERVTYNGTLYKCLQAHDAQADWTPTGAPSLWAEVLPGQSGEIGEWKQPSSTNGYKTGDKVTHNGKTWESTADNNVWEPGAVGAPWKEVDA